MGRDQKMTLTGRTALITGAAGAIGKATARLLSEAGARLVLADMVRDQMGDLSREPGGLAVQADLSDPGAVSGMAAYVLDQVGRASVPGPGALQVPLPGQVSTAVFMRRAFARRR